MDKDKKEIRRQAEELLKTRKSKIPHLIHELEVHQIQLEMQNEELQRSRMEVEDASNKYHNLFDFAPIAYFVWNLNGQILEVNFAGAKLLGVSRDVASKMRFGQFVALRHRVIFTDFLKRVLATDVKQSCEVQLFRNEADSIFALIEAIATGKTTCQAAIVDITARKLAEDKLNEIMRERNQFVDNLKQEGVSTEMVAAYEKFFLRTM